jgi:hypothetical protein
MKMPCRLCVAALLWLCSMAAFAAEPATPEKRPAHWHLYLLIGQSNMAGRGEIEEQDRQVHPRVFMFTKDNQWAPAVDPLHFDKPIAGVSLGSTFGRVMADADKDVTIGLIPCAVGGTPLKRWQKDGDLWKQAVARAKAAMKDGTLRGILWHQGESDSGDKAIAESYGRRLAEMVVDLRKELDAPDVPFVAGKLGEFLAETSPEGLPSYWKLVNKQIESLPEHVPHTAVVDSAGLKSKADKVHFHAASLRELGRRYATAMQKL